MHSGRNLLHFFYRNLVTKLLKTKKFKLLSRDSCQLQIFFLKKTSEFVEFFTLSLDMFETIFKAFLTLMGPCHLQVYLIGNMWNNVFDYRKQIILAKTAKECQLLPDLFVKFNAYIDVQLFYLTHTFFTSHSQL